MINDLLRKLICRVFGHEIIPDFNFDVISVDDFSYGHCDCCGRLVKIEFKEVNETVIEYTLTEVQFDWR